MVLCDGGGGGVRMRLIVSGFENIMVKRFGGLSFIGFFLLFTCCGKW